MWPTSRWGERAGWQGDQVVPQIHQNACYKAIVLVSEYPDFLGGTEAALSEDVLEFQRLIVESEIPVVVGLEGNAKGQGWFMSQFCDACVYSQTGVYSAVGIGNSAAGTQMAAVIFRQHLGNCAGKEILLTGAEYTGDDLQQRVGTLLVAEQTQVLPVALKVARFWAQMPGATLAGWKKHTAVTLRGRAAQALPAAAGSEEKDQAAEGLPGSRR